MHMPVQVCTQFQHSQFPCWQILEDNLHNFQEIATKKHQPATFLGSLYYGLNTTPTTHHPGTRWAWERWCPTAPRYSHAGWGTALSSAAGCAFLCFFRSVAIQTAPVTWHPVQIFLFSIKIFAIRPSTDPENILCLIAPWNKHPEIN